MPAICLLLLITVVQCKHLLFKFDGLVQNVNFVILEIISLFDTEIAMISHKHTYICLCVAHLLVLRTCNWLVLYIVDFLNFKFYS